MNDLTRQLGQLERIQLVRRLDEIDLAYQFKHVLAQETTYRSMLVKKRRDIHLRVAQYYEQLYTESPNTDAAILAHHYFEAGDLGKTFHYALVAGDDAARLHAHAEALMFYDRALDMVRRLAGTPDAALLPRVEILRLYTSRGRVFELSNRYDLAVKNYIEMETEGRARGDTTLELAGMTLRATLLATYTSEFDPTKGRELNTRILARAQEIGDRAAEARINWIMLLVDKYGDGNMGEAIEHGERSLALARELGMRELIAYTLNDLASPYGMMTQFGASRAALQEAIQIWNELGNLAMLSDSTANLVQLDYYAGDFNAAVRASAEALRLSQLTGSLWGQSYSQMWIGGMFAELGDYGTALRVMQECLETAEAANFLPPQVATRIDYAWTLAELGQLDVALQHGARAAEFLQYVQPFALFVLTVRIRLALLAGDLAAAQALSAQESFSTESPFKDDPDGLSRVTLAVAELALTQREYARALEILKPAIVLLKSYHVVPYLPEILYTKFKVLEAMGDTSAALSTLEEAQRAAEVFPSRRVLWQILVARSELESRAGNRELAVVLRAQARDIVNYISERVGSVELEHSFLALPQVRSLFVTD